MSSPTETGRSRGGLDRRLTRTFLLQAAAIGFATIMGILTAGYVLEEVLIREALTREAEHYWNQKSRTPEFPLPNTDNLSGHLVPRDDPGDLPAALVALSDGFHRDTGIEGYAFVFLEARGNQRLYLVFDNRQVGQLALWFGIVPLMLVLTVLYISLWIVYRVSRRAVSPIVALAERVSNLEPGSGTFEMPVLEGGGHDSDDEVRILAAALSDYTLRIQEFVERERNFTRDVSHELRTPLTVIRIATEVLEAKSNLEPSTRQSIERIARSALEMQELVEMFLLLARESDGGLASDELDVNELVETEIARVRLLAADKPVRFEYEDEVSIAIKAPARALTVLVGNLLRNALNYTDQGSVRTLIDTSGIHITDSGKGIDQETQSQVFELYFRGQHSAAGHGIGLSIVKRLCDRFGWRVELDSAPGRGTTVHVAFPSARVAPKTLPVDDS